MQKRVFITISFGLFLALSLGPCICASEAEPASPPYAAVPEAQTEEQEALVLGGAEEEVVEDSTVTDIKAHLGEDYYLLTVDETRGNIYAISSGRTYAPSTGLMGQYVGSYQGGILVTDDAYSVLDILGSTYRLLAYTPERGNCYVNASQRTYTPSTNEIGMVTGYTEAGLPIIELTGSVRPVTRFTTTYTWEQAPSAPAASAPSSVVTIAPTTAPAYTVTTVSQDNALRMAKQYLATLPFSYSGMIDQLMYEGFSREDAVYGASSCGANWYEQAVLSAADYLAVQAFSHSGLVEQLQFEGFTPEQAEYGVTQNGL